MYSKPLIPPSNNTFQSFSPLKSLRRIIVSYPTTDSAVAVRETLDGTDILGSPTQIYLRLGSTDSVHIYALSRLQETSSILELWKFNTGKPDARDQKKNHQADLSRNYYLDLGVRIQHMLLLSLAGTAIANIFTI